MQISYLNVGSLSVCPKDCPSMNLFHQSLSASSFSVLLDPARYTSMFNCANNMYYAVKLMNNILRFHIF